MTDRTSAMTIRPAHLAAALGLIVIWGFNFVVIKVGLVDQPPIFLAFLRFVLSVLPAIFFVKRPTIPLSRLIQYGLTIFALQFAFLFSGIHLGISAGLASVAMQVHVFVTIGLAALFLGERPSRFQLIGAAVAFTGIVVIGAHAGRDVTLLGLTLVLLASMSWASGNIIAKSFKKVDALGLVVWGSLVALLPLLVLSLMLEGPARMQNALEHMNWLSAGAVAYLAWLSTLLGYGVWSWLLGRYPAASIAPLTLLVPVVGLASSALVLGEQLQGWKWIATGLVVVGLCINLFAQRIAAGWRAASPRPGHGA